MAKTVDVAEVIERQALSRFTVGLVVISWAVTFFDGFDMTVISFTSKYLTHDFQLSKLMLGNIFSAGLVGVLISGLLFGYIADRIGRRPSIIICTGGFSLVTIALGFARTYEQMLALRFLDGLMLGGAIPLLWALNIEFSPKRFRARIVTIIMLGYGFGVSASGPLARAVIPHFGWQGVFWFGGAASLVSTVILLVMLPESLRFMVSKGAPARRIAAVLKRLAPADPAPADARFVCADEAAGEAARKAFHPGQLFRGPLRWITPMIWLAFIFSSIAAYFLTTWGPLVLEEMGFGADGAAWLSAANSTCGAVGALVIMNFTDRKGPLAIAVLPIVSAPLLLIAGLVPMGLSVFFVLSLCLSVFLGGAHYAVQSIVGIFYPSAIRANGSGWAGSIAKIGSISAPLIGAAVLSTNLPVKATYALLAVCPAVYLVCIVVIGVVERRMRGKGAEPAAPAAAAPALAGE